VEESEVLGKKDVLGLDSRGYRGSTVTGILEGCSGI